MHRLIRSLLASAVPALMFVVGLPLIAVYADRWLSLQWYPSLWLDYAAGVVTAFGAGLAVWSFWALTFRGDGTPNPLVPTVRLVESGPFRRSRNPLMLGGWVCGAGLAGVLHSPSLLIMVAVIAAAGSIYVRVVEEPGLQKRFGAAWTDYARRTPRWLTFR